MMEVGAFDVDGNVVVKVTETMTTAGATTLSFLHHWYVIVAIVLIIVLGLTLTTYCIYQLCCTGLKSFSSSHTYSPNKSLSSAIRNNGKSSGPGSLAVGTGSLLSVSSTGSAGSRSLAPLIQGHQTLPDIPIPERRPSARSNSIDPAQIQSDCYSQEIGIVPSEAEPVLRSRSDDNVGSSIVSSADSSSLGTLHFTLAYEVERLALSVTIVKITDLSVRQLDSSNPYVKLQLLPEKSQKAKTRIVRRSVNPLYNESFTFYGIEADQLRHAPPSTSSKDAATAVSGSERQNSPQQVDGLTLHLAVLSFDSFARDEFVGEFMFPLNEVDLTKRAGRPVTLSRALRPRTTSKVFGTSPMQDRGELLVSLCYQPTVDRLTVIVLKAKNLPRMDIYGLSDPYVKVYLAYNGQRIAKKKTHVKKRTLNPIFNESFTFDLPPSSSVSATPGGPPALNAIRLEFVVFDWDRVTRNEVIGRLDIGDRVKDTEGHWTEVISCPRKQIAEWHRLKP